MFEYLITRRLAVVRGKRLVLTPLGRNTLRILRQHARRKVAA